MKKRGFTLIELLAVIVILAVIALIATPIILGIINDSKINVFKENTRVLIRNIEYAKLNNNLDITTINEDNIESILGTSNINYKTISVSIVNDETYITAIGKNTFDGLVVSGTQDNVKISNINEYVNEPLLAQGMIPIKWNGTEWITTKTSDPEWYNYNTTDKKWANAVNVGPNNKIVVDASNNKFHGILRNGASFADGGLTLDGIDDYVELPKLPSTINWQDGITIEFSAKWDNNLNWSRIFDFNNGAGMYNILIANPNTTSIISLVVNGIESSNGTNIGITHSNRTDYKIVITKNNEVYNVVSYENEVQVNSETIDIDFPIIDRIYNYIGKSAYDVDAYFDGTIYNLKITQADSTKIMDFDFTNANNYYDLNTDTNAPVPEHVMNAMWVWIPRYIYNITSGWHSNESGTIDVKFSVGTDDTRGDTIALDTDTSANASNNKWTNHPGFTFGDTQVTGIWVAKFEASAAEGVANGYTADGLCPIEGDNSTTKTIKSVPNATTWRCISASNMFTNIRNMETNSIYGWNVASELQADGNFMLDTNNINTHLMKNIEWGAVSYLSKSNYGQSANEIYINNSQTYTTGCAGNTVSDVSYNGCQNIYNTSNGVKASTTGNIYGIYDMSGGTWEYVSAYVNNENGSLSNGASIVNAASQYKDVYTAGSTDDQASNYGLTNNFKGDAIYETSNNINGSYSWFSDYSIMPSMDTPWLLRGCDFAHGFVAGTFSFINFWDGAYSGGTFRPVLLVGSGL